MIRVQYWPKMYAVRIEGHAGYAEPGKDIVCAGASALTNTVLCAAQEYNGVSSPVKDGIVIGLSPRLWQRGRARRLMDSLVDGYRVLAHQYPEYVEVKEMGE